MAHQAALPLQMTEFIGRTIRAKPAFERQAFEMGEDNHPFPAGKAFGITFPQHFRLPHLRQAVLWEAFLRLRVSDWPARIMFVPASVKLPKHPPPPAHPLRKTTAFSPIRL